MVKKERIPGTWSQNKNTRNTENCTKKCADELQQNTHLLTHAQMKTQLANGSLRTGHAGVSAEAAVEFTVDQRGIEKPLSEQMEDAVDPRPSRGWQGPRLPAALVGAGEKGWGGRRWLLLLLLLLGCFGWLIATTL